MAREARRVVVFTDTPGILDNAARPSTARALAVPGNCSALTPLHEGCGLSLTARWVAVRPLCALARPSDVGVADASTATPSNTLARCVTRTPSIELTASRSPRSHRASQRACRALRTSTDMETLRHSDGSGPGIGWSRYARPPISLHTRSKALCSPCYVAPPTRRNRDQWP